MNKSRILLLACLINCDADSSVSMDTLPSSKNNTVITPYTAGDGYDKNNGMQPSIGGAATATTTIPTSPTNPTPSRVDQAINLGMEIARSEVVQNTIKTLAALGTSAAVTAIKSTYDGDRALGNTEALVALAA